jgi:hypothetical protein
MTRMTTGGNQELLSAAPPLSLSSPPGGPPRAAVGRSTGALRVRLASACGGGPPAGRRCRAAAQHPGQGPESVAATCPGMHGSALSAGFRSSPAI